MSKEKKSPHIPIRTCIACGIKRPKKELLRLALNVDKLIVIDYSQRMSGRGAYVCHSCIHRLKPNKRLERAFRGQAKALSISNIQFV
ncbi:MAG: YlxR family protein [Syntrophobacterales bacterium]|nr:YlxR family protein [Syntrophobacterales bacterium]